jgi:hypothetical protein
MMESGRKETVRMCVCELWENHSKWYVQKRMMDEKIPGEF